MSYDIVIRTLGQEGPPPTSFSTRRSAIYARVSVSSPEAGLNSLQAQVQACEAYIQSQRDTGWELVAPA
jgi:predicted site-specific integrase-resolvase